MRQLELAVAVCRLTTRQLMNEIPVTGALAVYRGQRYRILFSGNDWVAIHIVEDKDVPDAIARGESPAGQGRYNPWAKLPRSVLDGVVSVVVTATIRGRPVSLRSKLPDGRIGVEFVGPPDIAEELGLDGDQYMGWTGLFKPEDFDDIHVEETRRA